MSRIVLTVTVSERSHFRRSPHHLALPLMRRAHGEPDMDTWSHDSRGEFLRRRVYAATRTIATSNSISQLFLRHPLGDPGWHGQLLCARSPAVVRWCCWSTSELTAREWEVISKKRARYPMRNRLSYNTHTGDGRVRRSARRPAGLGCKCTRERARPCTYNISTHASSFDLDVIRLY